tara:strand:+ start:1120 stop:1656 length:537 start_codon:yes stop_codon:yes gene_type:complete
MQFDRPIPGQSLTTTPKSAPYERPPEISDPRQALEAHLDNLMKEDAMEDALFFLEEGLDLVTLVEGMLRGAVMEGIHSIDISLIIAPALHEFIKGAALSADIKFEEGFEDKKAKKAITYSRNVARAKRMLEELGEEDTTLDPMSLEDTQIDNSMETVEEPIEEPVEEPQQGLMARRVA